MKITLLCLPSPVPFKGNALHDIARTLQEHGHHKVQILDGAQSGAALAAIDRDAPELLLLGGGDDDAVALDLAEKLCAKPAMPALILLCRNRSPENLMRAMRAGVREVLASPPSLSELLEAVQRLAGKLAPQSRQGKVLAFVGCKGGAGATFLATNLGYQLAQDNSVLLIDLNLQFGDALAFVHDAAPALTLADVASNITRMDATCLAASTVKVAPNFSVLPAPEDASQAMAVKAEHVEAILNLAATMYDFVLLDTPRNFDAITMRALDRADRIYPVIQADLPGVRNAGKFLAGCRALRYPMQRVEVVLNRHDRKAELGLADIRRVLGETTLRTVPNCYRDVSAAVNRGNALLQVARGSAVTRHLADFAQSLQPRTAAAASMLDRLLRRA